MVSIGPQIPEHLLKRRREDEIDQGDSDEEVVPKPETTPGVPIGPQMPTHLINPASPKNDDDEEEEEEDYGPALPPDLVTKRPGATAGTSETKPARRSPSPPTRTRRIVGPSLPGHERMTFREDDEYEEGDEDEFGPMPLPEGVKKSDSISEGVREFIEKEQRRNKEIEEAAKPKKPQREEWMLVPPTSSDLLGHLSDPLKLKARQFSRGSSTASRSAPNNLWTETPAERAQRVADEVAGKKRHAANVEDDDLDDRDAQRRKQRDTELRKVIDDHNKSSRGKTLVEMHDEEKRKEKKKKKDADEKPPMIWDHARDMAPGGKLMDEKQRSKMISEARSLGDRFGSGKSGGYL